MINQARDVIDQVRDILNQARDEARDTVNQV
jgi:hypothetical protein